MLCTTQRQRKLQPANAPYREPAAGSRQVVCAVERNRFAEEDSERDPEIRRWSCKVAANVLRG